MLLYCYSYLEDSGMWFERIKRRITVLFVLYNGCEATNADFNEQIRDYSVIHDSNLTNVKTLQKEQLGITRYASFAPLHNIARYKDVPDSALSGSSHSRGLLHHDHAGYGLYEYDDPSYSHGHGYDYHGADHDHDVHHHSFHEPHHHHGYHHHKHYDHHALAAKTILWPIAGIALLGAAAALVSNPVLLQLGVVSGRKKRHIENLDIIKDSLRKWSLNAKSGRRAVKLEESQTVPQIVVKNKVVQKDNYQIKPTNEPKNIREHRSSSNYKVLKVLSKRYTDEDEQKLVPVPLIFSES